MNVSYLLSLFSYKSPRSREEIVETAEYYLKNKKEWGGYNLASNNCEHFAAYCATGEKRSGQVVKAVAAGIIGVAGIGLAAKTLDSWSNKDKYKGTDEDITKDHNIMSSIVNGDFEAGDILYREATSCKFFSHCAVYIGDNNVIDLTSENGIQIRSLSEFASGCEVHIKR